MNKIFNSVDLIPEIQWVIAIILMILVFATILFWIWNKISPSKLVDEMQIRTRSWWVMCFIFLFASLINPQFLNHSRSLIKSSNLEKKSKIFLDINSSFSASSGRSTLKPSGNKSFFIKLEKTI